MSASSNRCSVRPALSMGAGSKCTDETERYIDHAVREVAGHALQRAVQILKDHRKLLEETAQVLQEKETLDQSDLAAVRAKLASSLPPETPAKPHVLPAPSPV